MFSTATTSLFCRIFPGQLQFLGSSALSSLICDLNFDLARLSLRQCPGSGADCGESGTAAFGEATCKLVDWKGEADGACDERRSVWKKKNISLCMSEVLPDFGKQVSPSSPLLPGPQFFLIAAFCWSPSSDLLTLWNTATTYSIRWKSDEA